MFSRGQHQTEVKLGSVKNEKIFFSNFNVENMDFAKNPKQDLIMFKLLLGRGLASIEFCLHWQTLMLTIRRIVIGGIVQKIGAYGLKKA